MKSLIFTHVIVVPNSRETLDKADGYFDELKDVKSFNLSQKKFDDLWSEGGLFDAFDKAFNIINDDLEEERIERESSRSNIYC